MDTLITATDRKSAAKAVTAASHVDGNDVVLALDCRKATDACAERAFSLYIVVCEGLGKSGVRLVKTLTARGDGGVIAVLPQSAPAEEAKALEDLREEGVLLVPATATQAELSLAVNAAIAANRRIEKLLRENRSLLKKIDDIRIVDRAKLILMQNMGYTEAQAHKQIEKRAMNERLSRAEVAMNILKTYEV
ncbi:MAG: ANTAR domain-containing protein [Clostridiales bacterium]|nr:ANTAR domain-containing protein [Clostridiales bacterium]